MATSKLEIPTSLVLDKIVTTFQRFTCIMFLEPNNQMDLVRIMSDLIEVLNSRWRPPNRKYLHLHGISAMPIICGISPIDFRLACTVLTQFHWIVRPQNIGLSLRISLQSCIDAEIIRFLYFLCFFECL